MTGVKGAMFVAVNDAVSSVPSDDGPGMFVIWPGSLAM
jgi:hypothetical protein